MRTEDIQDDHEWLRIADPAWTDPLDPSFAASAGGRWNPPQSFPVLYLNEDIVTARLNIRAFVSAWPYEPEDLRNDNGPVLVGARLPSGQRVVDIHSPQGVAAVGLPPTYPLTPSGAIVAREVCQPIGAAAKEDGRDGIRCRCAQSPSGEGRELAWFPDGPSSAADQIGVATFTDWYWS
ncbi:MAG: RES family NAD+ phosphorylase [bacterium]|nr:RES family NAD+ phosphorylase [bacterium]MCP4967743.1 RES family NAD+ phosphorylase [bacterium]